MCISLPCILRCDQRSRPEDQYIIYTLTALKLLTSSQTNYCINSIHLIISVLSQTVKGQSITMDESGDEVAGYAIICRVGHLHVFFSSFQE